VAKKRRVTINQARLLAIRYIQQALVNKKQDDEHDKKVLWNTALIKIEEEVFKDILPEKWYDGNTSEQSWEHVWIEMHIQLENIVGCLSEEAQRIQQENPDFQHKV
jgi:hypothetical protein